MSVPRIPTTVCEKIHLTPSNATAGKNDKQDICWLGLGQDAEPVPPSGQLGLEEITLARGSGVEAGDRHFRLVDTGSEKGTESH